MDGIAVQAQDLAIPLIAPVSCRVGIGQSVDRFSLFLLPDLLALLFISDDKVNIGLLVAVEHFGSEGIRFDGSFIPSLSVEIILDRLGGKFASAPRVKLVACHHQLVVVHPADIRFSNIIGITVRQQILTVHCLAVPLTHSPCGRSLFPRTSRNAVSLNCKCRDSRCARRNHDRRKRGCKSYIHLFHLFPLRIIFSRTVSFRPVMNDLLLH